MTTLLSTDQLTAIARQRLDERIGVARRRAAGRRPATRARVAASLRRVADRIDGGLEANGLRGAYGTLRAAPLSAD